MKLFRKWHRVWFDYDRYWHWAKLAPAFTVFIVLVPLSVGIFLIAGIKWAALFSVLAIVLAVSIMIAFYLNLRKWQYQSGFWGKFYKLQLVRNILFNNNLFKSENNSQGDTVVSYWPRVRVSFDSRNEFSLYLPMDGNSFQNRFRDGTVAKDVISATRATLADERSTDGYLVQVFLVFPKNLRVRLSDIEVTDHSIQVMQDLTWNFAKVPHLLLVGDTGSGKSYFLFSLIIGILKSGAEIRVADPKNTDLGSLSETVALKGRVYKTTETILKGFTDFYEGMIARSQEYSELALSSDDMTDYRGFGLQAHFFVFDEFAAFANSLDYRTAETLRQQLGQITMLGRQLGYFVIAAMQKPDADVLGSAARDQFQARVSLGKMKSSGLKMIFPDDDTDQFVNLDQNERGWGYIQLSPDKPRAFFSPEIEPGFKPKTYFNQLGKNLGITPIQEETSSEEESKNQSTEANEFDLTDEEVKAINKRRYVQNRYKKKSRT